MLAALVTVAEVGGGVEQSITAAKLGREPADIGHISLDNFNREAGELSGCLITRPGKRLDVNPSLHERTDEVVAEQPGGACNERGLHGGIILLVVTGSVFGYRLVAK